jgi:hypothetical protein
VESLRGKPLAVLFFIGALSLEPYCAVAGLDGDLPGCNATVVAEIQLQQGVDPFGSRRQMA